MASCLSYFLKVPYPVVIADEKLEGAMEMEDGKVKAVTCLSSLFRYLRYLTDGRQDLGGEGKVPREPINGHNCLP